MKTIRISATVYLLVGVALGAGAVSVGFLLWRCAQINEDYQRIFGREVAQAEQIGVLQVDFKKQVQAWKDILLRGGDTEGLNHYSAEFRRLNDTVDAECAQLRTTVEDPGARNAVEQFSSQHRLLFARYDAALAEFASTRDAHAADAAVKGVDRAPTDLLDQGVAKLNERMQGVREKESARIGSELRILMFVLAGVWLALIAWGVRFTRSLAGRLARSVQFVRQIAEGDLTAALERDGRQDELGVLADAMDTMRNSLEEVLQALHRAVERMAVDANTLAASSTQIARGSTEQRDQASQVAAAMHEMEATIAEVKMHCERTAKISVESGDAARQGQEAMRGTVERIRTLAERGVTTAEVIHHLGKGSEQIGQVVGTIREIAEQTNLLALNASIEAARAGEHGRGFAVVAGEVRRLAERTTTATGEIGRAIEQIQERTKQAIAGMEASRADIGTSVESVDQTAVTLVSMVEGTERVQRMVHEITTATGQQSEAAAQISHSMQNIANMVAQSSEGAEESARVCEAMNGLAGELRAMVERFQLRGGAVGSMEKEVRRHEPGKAQGALRAAAV